MINGGARGFVFNLDFGNFREQHRNPMDVNQQQKKNILNQSENSSNWIVRIIACFASVEDGDITGLQTYKPCGPKNDNIRRVS